MALRDIQPRPASSAEAEVAPKRRKVRKGTQSCWTCKRLKVKCNLNPPDTEICDACVKRNIACVSQEYPEVSVSNQPQICKRLDRRLQSTASHMKTTNGNQAPYDGRLGEFSDGRHIAEARIHSNGPSSHRTAPRRTVAAQDKYTAINQVLLDSWPSSSDLEIILAAPASTVGLSHGIFCLPHAELRTRKTSPARELLELPSPEAHPVLLARKLLLLGSYLQSFTPAAFQYVAGRLSTDVKSMMSSLVATAVRQVVSDDDLIHNSVDGVECIIMQSMYENNSGKLQRAQLAIRRALAVGQMMSLDRRDKWASLQYLEPDTRKRIVPEIMWFRILQCDRYFSIMLGLPTGSSDVSFADPERLAQCTPVEQMERMLAMIGGRLVQHIRADPVNLQATGELDRQLLEIGGLLPAQWWLPPTPPMPGIDMDEATMLQEHLRLMSQVSYYHSLVRLHLPHLLSNDQPYDYSKSVVVTASRELLSRYHSFRVALPGAACFCRGIDFVAFVSGAALCLAQINDILRRANPNHTSALAHHRLTDRGLVERVLGAMEIVLEECPDDAIAAEVASILRPLLAIEADVARSKLSHQTQVLGTVNGHSERFPGRSNDESVSEMRIPHFGTIKIGRNGITRVPEKNSRDMIATIASTAASQAAQAGASSSDRSTMNGHEYALDVRTSSFLATPPGTDLCNFQIDFAGYDPGLDSEAAFLRDDWALQGVDVAFFDSLFSDFVSTA